jgi:hypothetical protein
MSTSASVSQFRCSGPQLDQDVGKPWGGDSPCSGPVLLTRAQGPHWTGPVIKAWCEFHRQQMIDAGWPVSIYEPKAEPR